MAAKKIALSLLSCLILFPVLAFSREITLKSSKIKKDPFYGPVIGLIAASQSVEKEFFAVNEFIPHPTDPYVDLSGRRFLIGSTQEKNVIYVRSGQGMVNAAAATQTMLDNFNVTLIVHFGIAGKLNSSLNIGDVVIPKQFVHAGLWDWLKPLLMKKATSSSNDHFANLHIKEYNVPEEGSNSLGHIEFTPEEFYSEAGTPNVPEDVVFFNVSEDWLTKFASELEEFELDQCIDLIFCVKHKPKVVIGPKASTSNIFVDNAAYGEFLFETVGVSSADMESSAVIMTSLSNGSPVVVFRGLSNLPAEEVDENISTLYKAIAVKNVAKAVGKYISLLFQIGRGDL